MNNNYSKRGQTATEYMIIVAVVIVIAVVVASILGEFPGIGSGTTKNIDDYKLTTSKIAVDDYGTVGSGSLIKIRNNNYETLIANVVLINDEICDDSRLPINLNVGQSIVLNCSGIIIEDGVTPNIQIAWTDVTSGASYTQGEGGDIPEVCGNSLDDDGDGYIDCGDSDCMGSCTSYYRDENSIIKAPGLSIGDTFELEGVTYTVRDRTQLYSIRTDANALKTTCTTHITDMSGMFNGLSVNPDISSWDVSNVTTMNNMFRNNYINQDLSKWDVSSVLDMSYMFYGTYYFNQDISSWNVSSVTNMERMFPFSSSFNQDLSSWCVTNIGSKPVDFDLSATSWLLPRPLWGTCPLI